MPARSSQIILACPWQAASIRLPDPALIAADAGIARLIAVGAAVIEN
jgi:hypothetical protein